MLLTLISGKTHGINAAWKIIGSFLWVVPLYVTVQQVEENTKRPSGLSKGDHDRLIEVKITSINGK